MSYNDQAYESMAKKYVFEFQDPFDKAKSEEDLENEDPKQEEGSRLL